MIRDLAEHERAAYGRRLRMHWACGGNEEQRQAAERVLAKGLEIMFWRRLALRRKSNSGNIL